MAEIIQLLPDSLANQIAAGEVVQRPASVVKELLENSIDARATEVQLIIRDSGKALIQVTDNGAGMSMLDARMSFERHATSKITQTDDLFAIRTLGFRGEALASIAAVAQVHMKTRELDTEMGVSLEVEATQIKKQEPAACPEGTSISVKNLFFNTPARRNFLKSDAVEYKHIVEEFQRVALAHPKVAMSMYHNDQEVYHLRSGKLSQRIVELFGKSYQEQLVHCEENTDHVQVFGYIGKPEFSKKTRGEQYFYVNNRYIKSNYLNHAVMTAYEGLLADGQHPFYVLFIRIDPRHIDVNVHPTKTEIKFDDERTTYGIVKASVRSSLAKHNVTPSLDFDHDINFGRKTAGGRTSGHNSVSDKFYSQFKMTPQQRSNLENWERLFDDAIERSNLNFDSDGKEELSYKVESAANDLNKANSSREDKDKQGKVFQLHRTYIVTQVKSGMMMVDQEAAHERILFEKYLEQLENKSGMSQQSLFPQQFELNTADYALVNELSDEIRALGFDFESFGKNCIIVNGLPADLAHKSEKDLFEGLLEQFKLNKSGLSLSVHENLARSLAKRSAIGQGTPLGLEEMNSIIDQLFGCSNPNYAPDGRVTFFIMDLNKIANYFN